VSREFDAHANGVNSFLHSHVIKGKRVLPFTLTSAAMGQMARDTHPGYALVAVTDVQYYRGMICEAGVSTIPLEFVLQAGKEVDGQLQVAVGVTMQHGDKMVPAYKCVAVLAERAPKPKSVAAPSAAETGSVLVSKTDVYNGKTLFHGSHFQTIQAVTFRSADKIVAELAPVDLTCAMGQFPGVDGFLADSAFQLALVHARLQHNSGALPNFAKSFEFYQSLPAGVKAFLILSLDERSGDKLRWKYTVCDAAGSLYQAGVISVVLNQGLTWE
jgi:hypothetical protein